MTIRHAKSLAWMAGIDSARLALGIETTTQAAMVAPPAYKVLHAFGGSLTYWLRRG